MNPSKVVLVLMSSVLLLLPGLSQAQAKPRSYAVMSLIGNSISLAQYLPETGSRIEGDNRSIIEIKDTVFDNAAVLSANATIKKMDPLAQTHLMLTQDQGLYKAQNEMFDAVDANKDNREFLKSLLKARAVTHLVLITKYRGEAWLRLEESYTGHGRLEGLGFYIDDTLVTRNTKTLNTATGIIAPFAYVKLRLIDAATLDVLNEKYVRESQVVGNANATANGMYTWNILTGKEKIAYLQGLLAKAMDEAMPRLLGK